MQQFVATNMAKLPAFLADAEAWDKAPAVAADEDVTDWALLCLAADKACAHGDQCPYHKAGFMLLPGPHMLSGPLPGTGHVGSAVRRCLLVGGLAYHRQLPPSSTRTRTISTARTSRRPCAVCSSRGHRRRPGCPSSLARPIRGRAHWSSPSTPSSAGLPLVVVLFPRRHVRSYALPRRPALRNFPLYVYTPSTKRRARIARVHQLVALRGQGHASSTSPRSPTRSTRCATGSRPSASCFGTGRRVVDLVCRSAGLEQPL